jgi:dTDP-4-amino-4,6-dideoxygalactose transaminase
VIAVDVFGQCADYASIVKTCRFYEVPLIEDAAEALGATYRGRPAGSFGEIGCFSFNGNKIITTSGGGMLVTDSADWAKRARFLSTQARDPAPHYEHSVVGYNYRMSNLLAAVGRGQLRVLDERVNRRRQIFTYYERQLGSLPGILFMPELDGSRSTRWLTCMVVDPVELGVTREEIRLALDGENIEARPVWKPMHAQPAFAHFRKRGGSVADRLFELGLCLPSGSSLTDAELARIVGIIQSLVGSKVSGSPDLSGTTQHRPVLADADAS